MNITELIIGSGGARGMVALGALHALQKEDLLSKVRVYHGTSVGALLCVGLVLDRPCHVIMSRIVRYPLELGMECRDGLGMDSGMSLIRFIRRVLRIPHSMTLYDMYRSTGKTVYICVCNVTKQKVEYWSHKTHPEMSVLKALRCSCSIPVLFRPCKIGGHMYVDGAVGRHLPPAQNPSKALSLHFTTANITVSSWTEYLQALSNISDTPQSRYNLALDAGSIDPFSFQFTKETAHEYFSDGKRQALLFIKKNM